MNLPEPTGLMKDIRDEILAHSPRPNPMFAMAGSVSLMSALCLGRFKLNGLWPMMFNLVIGEKSSGKNAPRDFCSKVLTNPLMRGYNLFGQIHHGSKQSLILSLPKQRTRLDLVDEYSGFLNNYQRDNSYARDAALELTQIWSLNGAWYGGIKSVTRKDDTGECYGPAISLMALIQPDPFVEIVNRDMIDTGFLSRFLFFYSSEILDINCDPEFLFRERNVDKIVLDIRRMFPSKSVLSGLDDDGSAFSDPGLIEPCPESLTYSRAVNGDMGYIWKDFDKKQFGEDPISRFLYSKAFEHMTKLVIIKVVSEDRREVRPDDIDWARQLVEALISNCKDLIRQAAAGNRYEKFLESVREYMRSQKFVSKSQFTRRFQKFERWQRENALRDLVDCDQLEIEDSKSSCYYKWNEF